MGVRLVCLRSNFDFNSERPIIGRLFIALLIWNTCFPVHQSLVDGLLQVFWRELLVLHGLGMSSLRSWLSSGLPWSHLSLNIAVFMRSSIHRRIFGWGPDRYVWHAIPSLGQTILVVFLSSPKCFVHCPILCTGISLLAKECHTLICGAWVCMMVFYTPSQSTRLVSICYTCCLLAMDVFVHMDFLFRIGLPSYFPSLPME